MIVKSDPAAGIPKKKNRRANEATVRVRFAPESGHVRCTTSCLLWAKSGHKPHLTAECGSVRPNVGLIQTSDEAPAL
jgi:hypothetical protein